MTSAWIDLTGPRAEALAARHGTQLNSRDSMGWRVGMGDYQPREGAQ